MMQPADIHPIPNKGRRGLVIIAALGLLSLVVLSVAPFIGMKHIPPGVLVHPSRIPWESEILWRFRIPRVLTAFLAGAGLGLSGMAFQAMFRNPLATPFTLGVSSGAAFGASVYMSCGITFGILGISGITLSAFIGAILAILIVYALSTARRGFSTASMLLAGVAISFFFSSLIMFIQYLCDFTHSFRILRWLMGGLEVIGFDPFLTMIPFVTVGGVVILFLTHELNLLTVGEEIAVSRGVALSAVKKLIFFATSLMVGGVVAVCGPIGFVGMMTPHICRLVIGPNHRHLTPATLLFGGVFLTLCDTLARTLIAPAEIPVGIITALLGGPFFLWLLIN